MIIHRTMIGVKGKVLRSAKFKSLPCWPINPSSLLYNSPSNTMEAGRRVMLDRAKSAIALARAYGTCPARSALVACVED